MKLFSFRRSPTVDSTEGPKPRRVSRYDLPLNSGVGIPRDFRYDNELERYARYLELKLRFYEYEHMADGDKNVLRAKVKAYNDDAAERSGPTFDGGSITVIPSCSFNCGTTPCGCDRYYKIYQEYHKIYSGYFVDNNGCGYSYCVHRIIEGIDNGEMFLRRGNNA